MLTAAKNRFFTADDIAPAANLDNILNATGTPTEKAWRFLMAAESSDYWYWDGTEVWDSNVTRGSNLAVAQADQVINSYGGTESTPPSVFIPQREAYNPGGLEWGSSAEDSDFEVWTYAYDVSGLQSVTLKYRVDADGENPLASIENETYAGGAEVGDWVSIVMDSSDVAPPSGILSPSYRALRYGGDIAGLEDSLVDYYVEAIDGNGNIQRTDIQHVYVGVSAIPGGDRVLLTPDPAVADQSAVFTYDSAGGVLSSAGTVYAHIGFNNWDNTLPTDVAMTWDSVAELWSLSVDVAADASQLDLVFNDGLGNWDNNNGGDWHFNVTGGIDPGGFVMDGVLDEGVTVALSENGITLYWKLEGDQLYLATEDAGEGSDAFIYLAETPGALGAANWGKSGQVAGWDAFLADEDDNDYEGWTDNEGSASAATGANGGVLEGVIDLTDEFGEIPEEVRVAVALFATGDGGALTQVLAALNANGSVDAGEYLTLVLAAPSLTGDYNGDGFVNAADYTVWRDSLNSTTELAADGNNDGVVDIDDYNLWRDNFGATSASSAESNSVPEPTALLLYGLAAGAILLHPRLRITAR